MSQIRQQSIISSLVIFLGFGIGVINSIIFAKPQWFTPSQYGLTRSFFDFSTLIYIFSFWGASGVIYKFFPFYQRNLQKKENDLLTLVLSVALIGFLLFFVTAIGFKPFFERKFGANSKELVSYYYWLFPFGLGMLLFNMLETYCQTLKKSVIGNFLKETILRLLTLLLIVSYIFNFISFDLFIKIFAFLYPILVIVQLVYLYNLGELHFTFTISRVTRKFYKKMIPLALLIFVGGIILNLSSLFDSIIISSKIGLASLGIFANASYIANIVQIPQRSIVGISVPHLSEAWKNKDYTKINRIYKRSSINLLIISLLLFGGIWLCYDDIIEVLQLNEVYKLGKYVFLFLGIKTIIDSGTGVNGQIISTSNYWYFEFFTGLILLSLIIPLNYYLIPKIGIVGAGVSTLVAYTLYNFIRIVFLWKKFSMSPFSVETVKVLAICAITYLLAFYLFKNMHGWAALIIRSGFFGIVASVCLWYFKCSPDLIPVINTVKKKLGFKTH